MKPGKKQRAKLERRRLSMTTTHERLSRDSNYKGDPVKAYKMPGSNKK